MRGLDIFSGGGGSSAGARVAGVEMVGAIDMCPVATSTYADNFPNAQVKTSKLEDVSLRELRRNLGNIDILLSSPECTNHTCAKGSAPRSEESRATAMQVVEYAKTFKPRWIVLENVVHMRPWSRYNELKKELSDLGYNLGEQVLDASDFGVPQSRRRLFLVADRRQSPGLVDKVATARRKKAVQSVLDPDGTWKTSSLFTEKRASDTLARARRAFAEIGEDTPFLLVYYGTDGGGGWQPVTRPLRTITTVDRFALVTPGRDGHQMRMLQVSELRKAMGFEKSYKFKFGTRRDQIRLLGNGVCPPVMTRVVKALTADQA